jgi:hypothetical protein
MATGRSRRAEDEGKALKAGKLRPTRRLERPQGRDTRPATSHCFQQAPRIFSPRSKNQLEIASRCLYQRLTKRRKQPVFPAWNAALAQVVEHIIRNDGVAGSSPASGTISDFLPFWFVFSERNATFQLRNWEGNSFGLRKDCT